MLTIKNVEYKIKQLTIHGQLSLTPKRTYTFVKTPKNPTYIMGVYRIDETDEEIDAFLVIDEEEINNIIKLYKNNSLTK